MKHFVQNQLAYLFLGLPCFLFYDECPCFVSDCFITCNSSSVFTWFSVVIVVSEFLYLSSLLVRKMISVGLSQYNTISCKLTSELCPQIFEIQIKLHPQLEVSTNPTCLEGNMIYPS